MRFTAFSTLGAGLIFSLSNLNGVKAIEATALYTDAVTYCSEAKSVLINEFDIQYHRANNSATFQISAASVEPNLNLRANIYANAYGRDLINVTIDLCDYLQGVLCPLPMINFTGYGTYPIPTSFTNGIPSLAWTVPDIEAFARITLTNTQTGETAACLQTTLSNGLTTRLLAVKWASAGLVIAAILVGLFHSTLRWSPSPAVYRWYDVLYLFQATASSALLEINYPSVYTNFALNFPWALGLFPSTGIQDAVTDLRNSTGGKLPTMAFSAIDYINRKSSPYNEAIALNSFFSLNSTAADFHSFAALTSPVDHFAAATSLARRAEIPTVSQQDTISTVTNGIPVYVNSVGIPTASAFDSIFIIYLISIAVVLAAHVVWGLIVFLADRFRSPENRGTGWVGHQRRGFWSFFAGNMMRVCLIFLFPVFIFSLYQFDIGRKDSWLSILLAALCFAWTVIGLTAVLVFAILRHRRRHTELSATSPLYTRYAWFNSAGMIYRQYRPKYHFWWFAPLALASFVRACFIAFGHGNPWAQVIGLVVVEFLVLVTCIGFRPHKDKKGDWLGATLALFRMVGFGLMIAWIPSMDVDPIIRTILGFVVLVMFALPVVLLFFGLLFNLAYGYAFRRHKRRIEDGTEIMPFRHVSDVDSETPAMAQVGTGITPLGSQDGSGIVNAGNGYRPTTMNNEMRQSYHPSIDGDGPGYQRDSYAAYATGYQPNHQDAYDGYTNNYPTQESTGSAYGGNGDRLEGYGGYGGYPSQDAQAAYTSVGQGGGQRYPDTYVQGHDQTMPGFHNRRSYADI